MSLNSVNTNMGAMVALQSLNRTNEQMAVTQKRISTGFRVADARDDGGAFAVATRVRSDLAATRAANQQLGGVKGLLDTTSAGVTNVANLLEEVKSTVVRLADSNINAVQREQYMTSLKQMFVQIQDFITDTNYNGQSMLNQATAATAGGTTLGEVRTIRNGEGASFAFAKIATAAFNGQAAFVALTGIGYNGATMLTGASLQAALSGFANALTAGGAVEQALNATVTALNNLGSFSRYVDSQITFNNQRMDAQEGGLGALVDADLARESAQLQALQIRQQLGAQALGIANQAPQVLLSLFR